MKKSNLKTGMRVTTRRGNKYAVLLQAITDDGKITDILASPTGWLQLDNYSDDLALTDSNTSSKGFEIVKVEVAKYGGSILKKEGRFETIWERQEPKELTLDEIEKELGYPVKIVEV